MLIPDSFDEQVTDRVAPSAGLSEVANPQAFGGGVGQTLDYGAQILTRAHYDAAQQANKVAALDKHNAVEAWTQKAWLDPQNGLRNQNLGAQAPAAANKLLSDFDNVVSTQRSALANDQQREMFDAQNDQLRQHLAGQTDEYAGQQLHAHAEGAYSAGVGLAHNAIANNPGDADAQVAKITGLVTNHAALNGFAPGSDESKYMVQGAVSDAHTTAMGALMAQGNFQGAQKYWDTNGAAIVGPEHLRVQEALKNGSVEQQAQDISKDFLDGTPSSFHATPVQIAAANGGSVPAGEQVAGPPNTTGTKGALNPDGTYDRKAFDDQVRNDPRLSGSPEAEKLRERVQAHGDARIEQAQQEVNEKHSQTYTQVYGMLQANDGVFTPQAKAAAANLPGHLQESLDRASDWMQKPDPIVNDDLLYATAIEKAATDRAYLRDMTAAQFVTTFRPHLDNQRYSQLEELWQDSLAHHHPPAPENPSAPGAVIQQATPPPLPNADLVQKVKSIGLNPAQSANFYANVQDDLNALDDKYKGSIPPEEKQKAISNALANSVFIPVPNAIGPIPGTDNPLSFGFDPGAIGRRNATPAAKRIPVEALTEDDLQALPAAQRANIRQRLAPPGALSLDEWKKSRQGAAAKDQ